MEQAKNFPTMIIPNGTDVSVNEHGQLSIRTPGNLVIQNSGVYSVIESGSGSVRIDPDVKVEAVSVQAADSCFVAGQLTAWRVRARTITLERGAQANIMLQESESLELDGNARLVGNFSSEKELYLMLGRFSRELRDLPNGIFAGDEAGARDSLPGRQGPAPRQLSLKIHSFLPTARMNRHRKGGRNRVKSFPSFESSSNAKSAGQDPRVANVKYWPGFSSWSGVTTSKNSATSIAI